MQEICRRLGPAVAVVGNSVGPWQESVDCVVILGVHVGQSLQKVLYVLEGDKPIFLGGLDDAVEHGARSGAGRGVGEETVLATDHEWFDGSFGAIVVDFEASVEQERGNFGLLVRAVSYRLAARGRGQAV